MFLEIITGIYLTILLNANIKVSSWLLRESKMCVFSKEVMRNDKDKTVNYELQLPTDELFKKVHGPIVLHYTVYTEKNIILLTNITPEGILDEGHRAELSTYKGVMISKTNPEKDMFKINLLNMLEK